MNDSCIMGFSILIHWVHSLELFPSHCGLMLTFTSLYFPKHMVLFPSRIQVCNIVLTNFSLSVLLKM